MLLCVDGLDERPIRAQIAEPANFEVLSVSELAKPLLVNPNMIARV